MKKSTKKELTKYLKQATKAELEKEIKMLYAKFKPVKKYYEIAFTNDTSAIIDEFKVKLRKEYFPNKGYGKARNTVSRKVIMDFKKISNNSKDTVVLLLYRTELMLEFTSTYGDIDEAFYNSLTRSFDEACRIIAAERLEEIFKNECERLLNEAYSLGWGVYDAMQYSYDQVM